MGCGHSLEPPELRRSLANPSEKRRRSDCAAEVKHGPRRGNMVEGFDFGINRGPLISLFEGALLLQIIARSG